MIWQIILINFHLNCRNYLNIILIGVLGFWGVVGPERMSSADPGRRQQQPTEHRPARADPGDGAPAHRGQGAQGGKQREQGDLGGQRPVVAHLLEVEGQDEQQPEAGEVHSAGDGVGGDECRPAQGVRAGAADPGHGVRPARTRRRPHRRTPRRRRRAGPSRCARPR